MTTADEAVLGVLEADVLRPAVVDQAVERVLEAFESAEADIDRRRAVDKRIAGLERELANLTAAVAAGGDVPVLVAGLQQRQRSLASAVAEREQMAAAPAVPLNRGEVRRRLFAKLADWRGLLAGDVGGARRLLELVLDGRIVFAPTKNQFGFEAYHVRIPLKLDRVLEGVLPLWMASPRGPDPFSVRGSVLRRMA
jgi:hypothetical protein